MFRSVRIQLTTWYLFIIMVVSVVFSGVLYKVATNELERFAFLQQARLEHQRQEQSFLPSEVRAQLPPIPVFDPTALIEARNRVLLILIGINATIFVISGGLGYFLAGRTLKPIQEMMNEQNRFVADASHELRTPLTALKSSIEVNLRDKSLSLPEAKKLLESNLEDVNQLQFLSDALLELAHYDQPNGNTFEKISLTTVVNDAVKKK